MDMRAETKCTSETEQGKVHNKVKSYPRPSHRGQLLLLLPTISLVKSMRLYSIQSNNLSSFVTLMECIKSCNSM